MKHFVVDRIGERITDGVAVGAISSPLWLSTISGVFEALLPIMGCAWIGIQMYNYFKHKDKDKK